jgi:hypothetical protein
MKAGLCATLETESRFDVTAQKRTAGFDAGLGVSGVRLGR